MLGGERAGGGEPVGAAAGGRLRLGEPHPDIGLRRPERERAPKRVDRPGRLAQREQAGAEARPAFEVARVARRGGPEQRRGPAMVAAALADRRADADQLARRRADGAHALQCRFGFVGIAQRGERAGELKPGQRIGRDQRRGRPQVRQRARKIALARVEHADEQPEAAVARRFRDRRFARQDRARGLAAPRQVDRLARLGGDRRNVAALRLAGKRARPCPRPRATRARRPSPRRDERHTGITGSAESSKNRHARDDADIRPPNSRHDRGPCAPNGQEAGH